jgi:hypothetical protein
MGARRGSEEAGGGGGEETEEETEQAGGRRRWTRLEAEEPRKAAEAGGSLGCGILAPSFSSPVGVESSSPPLA